MTTNAIEVAEETGVPVETVTAALADLGAVWSANPPPVVEIESAVDCGCCYGIYIVGPKGRALVGGSW